MSCDGLCAAKHNRGFPAHDSAIDPELDVGIEHCDELGFSTWSLVELIEAASRRGMVELASDALQRLSETTVASGTPVTLLTVCVNSAGLAIGCVHS